MLPPDDDSARPGRRRRRRRCHCLSTMAPTLLPLRDNDAAIPSGAATTDLPPIINFIFPMINHIRRSWRTVPSLKASGPAGKRPLTPLSLRRRHPLNFSSRSTMAQRTASSSALPSRIRRFLWPLRSWWWKSLKTSPPATHPPHLVAHHQLALLILHRHLLKSPPRSLCLHLLLYAALPSINVFVPPSKTAFSTSLTLLPPLLPLLLRSA